MDVCALTTFVKFWRSLGKQLDGSLENRHVTTDTTLAATFQSYSLQILDFGVQILDFQILLRWRCFAGTCKMLAGMQNRLIHLNRKSTKMEIDFLIFLSDL